MDQWLRTLEFVESLFPNTDIAAHNSLGDLTSSSDL